MPSESLTFPGHDGAPLAARLELPAGPVLATALFAHCFACGGDIAAAQRIAARLAAAGIAVLRFDFTGIGGAGEDFAARTFADNVADLTAAARFLEGRGMAPGLLIGHSLGGTAALLAASGMPSVTAVAVIGASFAPAAMARHFADAMPEIAAEGAAEVTLGSARLRIGRDFVAGLGGIEVGTAAAALHRALLVLHAPRDMVVGIENATRIFLAAKHPKSFVTLDDADHMISDPKEADYAAGVIAAWAAHYLDLAEPAPEGVPEGVVRVSEADPARFAQDITAGPRHHLIADEPLAQGGTDRGLSPYGLLSAALGACTSMTIRMYARRKKWPLDHVRVEVSHRKLHAEDAAAVEAAGGRIDVFSREIALAGPLDAEQRARLVEIADRCPVHRTLSHGATVETRLAG